ncbi:aromatic ring-hydroxylating dioxygenase subunit alpha [uncultured Maricaulis sp.]|uniref:aromatic ring-hydroxylating oxygenase subunit alpha n=1 Tax=uncultured Maricaulis sp. TaxID=174710 RepID=UPI0030D7ED40|tara:strand:- start:105364 stop:106449 length:1086 start_codon:yes stop_codon:yes gene_type:complete
MSDGISRTSTDPRLQTRPLAQASALSPDFYAGHDWLAVDQVQVLESGWQILCPASAVAEPGDHVVREIGRVPVLVVRGSNGALNGFVNVCRHRAGPLALCDGKGAKRLRCAYHGWTYDLDGQLRTAPEMQDAQDFDRAGIRLAPIELRQWQGMVFARAGSDGPDFATVMAGIDALVAPYDPVGMRHHHSRSYTVAANWKTYVDNFLEGYHLPFVHPGLSGIVSYPQYKTELADFWSLQRAPVSDPDGLYADGEALYFFIYPNTMLNILPGRMQSNRVVPDGPSRCRVEFDFYYAPGFEAMAPADDRFSDEIQEEDRLICERVQHGLDSGAYQPGRLSPSQEAGVWHWQNLLREAYARASGE